MPLLEIKASKKVTITCSLEESTAKQVDQYAHFLSVPGDDVVNQALEYVFSKDKEFQQYRIANPNGNAPSALRVKKPTPIASSTRGGRRAVAAETK
jgi:hypothetical protein